MERRDLFKVLAASFGAAAVLGSEARADAAGPTAAEQANLKLVTDFCAVWTTRDIGKALPFLADDCVYRMTETTPAVNGHDGIIQRLKNAVDTSSLVEFRILDSAVSGPIVITHRIDRFMMPRPLTWEGVGVFFVKDGKIKEWADYTIRTQR